jgi:hypothetical protein
MVPLAAFVAKEDEGLSGIASSGLTLEPTATPATTDGKRNSGTALFSLQSHLLTVDVDVADADADL